MLNKTYYVERKKTNVSYFHLFYVSVLVLISKIKHNFDMSNSIT